MAGQQALNPGEWIGKYADELYGYAMTKTGKTELAEDFVQDTFLSALKSLETFRGTASERTWLFSILKNKIADHYRKASTRFEVSENQLLGDEEEGGSFLDNFFDRDGHWSKKAFPQKWDEDESSLLDNKDFQKALQNCVGKLPSNWHTVVTLKFLEEKESEDICKDLNLTSSNYWVILHRAKLQLRMCIEKTWFKL